MILNPFPVLWEMPNRNTDAEFAICKYSKLYPLPCKHATLWEGVCKGCFFRQVNYRAMGQYKTKTIRVCDRCGTKIEDPDKMLYGIVRDREGNYLADQELCMSCAQELINWVNGEQFPNCEFEE